MQEKKDRLIAAGTTAALLLILALWLGSAYLSAAKHASPLLQRTPIELEETFIDVIEIPAPDLSPNNKAASATANEQQQSQPTPVSGNDLDNSGEPAHPTKTLTSKDEAPAKVKKPKEEKPGPSAEELKQKREQEEARRQANNEVTDAFNRAKGRHNNAKGEDDLGNDGKPDGSAISGSHSGTGSGTVGGGWAKPNYNTVKSNVPGSVKMTLTIDATGAVTRVEFTGGDPPAATNAAVRAAVAAEVKRHKFRRISDTPAPASTKAYITYTFL